MLIGIAGKTGSGKNYVASLLEKRGWRTLDLDIVAHQALSARADEIEHRLGPGLIRDDGRIDRKKLGAIVFSDEASLKILEEITYPWIEEKTRHWIAEEPEVPAAIHAINLHKSSLQNDCRAIIWVKASRNLRRKRVLRRDGRPWAQLRGRFSSQNGLNPKLFSPDAEIYSVRNSGNDAFLCARLDRILSRLRSGGPGRGK